MRIVDVREARVAISRYADPSDGPATLDTSIVAVAADTGVVGYGFASIGRFAQGGLIRERFAPRLMAARPADLFGELPGARRETIDPRKAWAAMMRDEKPGGHGERSVAVGALDMALWDLAAKAADLPLHRLLRAVFGGPAELEPVPVYAGGGYYFPADDLGRLAAEAAHFACLGLRSVKIKIGGRPLPEDLRRVEAVLAVVGDGGRLAVDAMNAYAPDAALRAAAALAPYRLRWFEDICDPLDYETHRAVAEAYAPPLSAGEALFSAADASNLLRYGGLRPGHDVLTFDPVHCYGLPEYLRIIALFEAAGWSRRDFQPHGGHLFGLQVAAGLGLGGCECNPHNFQPFGGFADDQHIVDGAVLPPEAPGIGFECRGPLIDLLRRRLSG